MGRLDSPAFNRIVRNKVALLRFRPNRTFRGTIHLFHYLLIFLLPVFDSAEWTCFVACLQEFVCGALRAPTTLSVKDKLDVFRNIFHPRVQLTHGNMYRAGYGAVLFQLPIFANVN